jgi:hypothetical protein
VVDLPVTGPVSLGKARSGVLDLVGVEFVVAVGVERVAKAVAPLRRRPVAPLRRLGGGELAAGGSHGQDAEYETNSHRGTP